MAKFRGHGDHEAKIGAGQFMQGALIFFLAPAAGKIQLMLGFQHRRLHRLFHIGTIRRSVGAIGICHDGSSPSATGMLPN